MATSGFHSWVLPSPASCTARSSSPSRRATRTLAASGYPSYRTPPRRRSRRIPLLLRTSVARTLARRCDAQHMWEQTRASPVSFLTCIIPAFLRQRRSVYPCDHHGFLVSWRREPLPLRSGSVLRLGLVASHCTPHAARSGVKVYYSDLAQARIFFEAQANF